MKQPANSCEVRKGCVVFRTDCGGEEVEKRRGVWEFGLREEKKNSEQTEEEEGGKAERLNETESS